MFRNRYMLKTRDNIKQRPQKWNKKCVTISWTACNKNNKIMGTPHQYASNINCIMNIYRNAQSSMEIAMGVKVSGPHGS